MKQLVNRVAEESERRGRFPDALRLLDLCNVYLLLEKVKERKEKEREKEKER